MNGVFPLLPFAPPPNKLLFIIRLQSTKHLCQLNLQQSRVPLKCMQETVAQRDSFREAIFHLRAADDVERRYAETRKQRRLTDDELQRMIHDKDKELAVSLPPNLFATLEDLETSL